MIRGLRSGDTFVRPHVDSVKTGDQSLRTFVPIVSNTMLLKSWKVAKCVSNYIGTVLELSLFCYLLLYSLSWFNKS